MELKEQITQALKEGLAGFKSEVTDSVKATVAETTAEQFKTINEKIAAIEALPISKLGARANFSSSNYKGYNLNHQLADIRRKAATDPSFYPVFANDEKAETFAKFLIDLTKTLKGDVQAQADLKEFYAKAQMQEGTDSEGGYLVPDEYAWDMVKLSRGKSFSLQKCSVINMSTDVKKLPKEAGLVTVAWTSEESDITEAEPTFGQVTLTASRLDGYAKVTNELLQDSAIDITGILTEQFATAIALELDNQVLNGTGSPVSGVLTAAAGYSVVTAGDAFSTITADDY